MKKILVRTNLFVSLVIVVGFAVFFMINFRLSAATFKASVENISTLTAEDCYYQIESIFTQPMYVSLTMANDLLLQELLAKEGERLNDSDFVRSIQDYLKGYRIRYGYDSVFLVSAQTGRYYHFEGIDRVLTPENQENAWYYDFLAGDQECRLNIDNDEAAGDTITAFVNCRITDKSGQVLGVIGVGMDVNSLQSLMEQYTQRYSLEAYLIDQNGTIQVSNSQTGFEQVNIFGFCEYDEQIMTLLENGAVKEYFWCDTSAGRTYVDVRYLPSLSWYLIVEKDTSEQTRQFQYQLLEIIIVIVYVIAAIVLAITFIIRKYNTRVIKMTREMEQERRTLFQAVTEQLYENIYELDITNNKAANDETRLFFESLGASGDTPYDEVLPLIAEKQIKEEFRQSYIEIFSPQNVLQAYLENRTMLSYDLLALGANEEYYWMRIMAYIIYWRGDDALHMITYRQNIDNEKRQETWMKEQLQRDSMTGLYDKTAIQYHIQKVLQEGDNNKYAFFIIDIDDFKDVNDKLGHATGDKVILEVAKTLRNTFYESDLIGRIGGDEFLVFINAPNRDFVVKKAKELQIAIGNGKSIDGKSYRVSVSIGIAMVPEDGVEYDTLYQKSDSALYHTKKLGKKGFTIYTE